MHLQQLQQTIEANDFYGYDPYDGLNSRLFQATPLYKSAFLRLCWIQFFKRCPVNLRRLFGVPKVFNPKGGALFLLGYMRLFRLSGKEEYKQRSFELYERLKNCVIRREKGLAWGYPFDWQARAFYVPAGTPNMVSSVFVGHALLDFYETFGVEQARDMARQVKEFILHEMINWEDDTRLCLNYIPGRRAEVHNASLMGAAFLSRIIKDAPDARVRQVIDKAVAFSVADINPDGTWPYGTMAHHRWVDNFHTAFNLEALLAIRNNLKHLDYDHTIRTVFRAWMTHMFLHDGTPKYYNNKVYPLDVHAVAEAIVLLSKVAGAPALLFTPEDQQASAQLLDKVLNFAHHHFWSRRGYFYYQKGKFLSNKILYMRWSQAWMFYALAAL